MTDGLVFLHAGAFSGSAPGLLRALRELTDVTAYDLMPLARDPRLAGARVRATAEARLFGAGTPWTKTTAWPRAVQGHIARKGLLDSERPVLIVQSLPAIVPPAGVRYAVYTDRVGLEGTSGISGVAPAPGPPSPPAPRSGPSPDPDDPAGGSGAHRSRYTPGWLDRERAMIAGAHRIYVMGHSTADAVVRRYGVPGERVEVVGAGVNVPADPPAAERRLPDGPPALLFVGVEWERKGGPELIEAFVRVHAENPAWRLTLAGGAPAGALPPGVTAVGRVPHDRMPELYARADALVIPTHREPFGIALVEAISRGLPCVGTTVGNQRTIVADAGILVEPGDVDALTRALRGLDSDYPGLRRRAEARGAVLRDTMTWPHVARTIWEGLG
ncbi:glycosyltransferase family 4 protein [Yinghuangia sp. ASG 101]|uniref:glycosyltransferase family 4 protein n=1 Tax=Yinghuangia sp. ASG 101 TaxID=2896848 RepID=UPI001E5118A6|nr:glycosyltransferase family 4 protein [Yinghuangia sp. ASG 101]UGQ10576.1 glycosyltransferase family 4 protein [Yinghuangia sp. ASG 101]